MIHIDGSQGEGGGQVLRSSLALSATTGQPFRIDHIRAGRARPGLLRQHLTCVRAVAAVCGAEVEGDALVLVVGDTLEELAALLGERDEARVHRRERDRVV